MKYIFYCTLLGNLLLLLWFQPWTSLAQPIAEAAPIDPMPSQPSLAASLPSAVPSPSVNPSLQARPNIVSTVAAVPQAEASCLFVLPVEGQGLAELQQRLRNAGLQPEQISIRRPVRTDYWLVMPPQASRADAQSLALTLRDQNIEALLINEGELSNGLSLGLFSVQANAQALRQRLLDLGYQPEVRTLARDAEQQWLRLPAAQSQAFRQMESGLSHNGVRPIIRRDSCETVAFSN